MCMWFCPCLTGINPKLDPELGAGHTADALVIGQSALV
jgi:hypothetical protein